MTDHTMLTSLRRTRATRAVVTVCTVAAITAAGAGCSLDPSTIKTSPSAEMTLVAQFANALNLPAGAHVTVNGADVGEVEAVRLAANHVDVRLAIDRQLQIPSTATASIRQSTILGDPYVAVETKTDTSRQVGFLSSGGVIPLARTQSPPSLETTLSVLSTFINGGSAQSLQEVIRSANAAFPNLDQTRAVASIAAVDLRDLSRQTSTIDSTLAGLTASSQAITNRDTDISTMLSPAGMHWWFQFGRVFEQVALVLPSTGSIFEGGFWLVPMLRAINGSVYTVRDGITAVTQNSAEIQSFLQEHAFPFLRRPSLQIVSATSPAGQSLTDTMTRILRILGAVR